MIPRVREWLRVCARVQGTTRFKTVASAVIVVLALLALGGWLVLANAPDTAEVARQAAAEATAADAGATAPRAATGATAVRGLLGATSPVYAVSVGILAVAGVLLVVTWLGVLLTYIGLGLVALVVVAPLWAGESTRGAALVIGGAVALSGSFTALLQGVRALLGYRTPVFAVAQTVLAEAVRMKISVVFIVMLVFLLAALPAYLDPGRPLRFRVQTFLQWGTAGAYWLMLMLTLFFSIATVAFEQRDKVIWQTMTKPVRPIEYILGKWLGVVSLNAALMLATASGVFLFTEYLRNQPAQGEIRAYVARQGEGPVTLDRRILETQVLTARRVIEPAIRELIEAERVDELVELEIAELRRRDDMVTVSARGRALIREDIVAAIEHQYRTIAPGTGRAFMFEGLSRERDRGEPVTLRFTVKSGSNLPSALYELTFLVGGRYFIPRQTSLGAAQTLDIPADAIDENGALLVDIWNGQYGTEFANPLSITFERGSLEILASAGSFELNYARVMLVLWLKLCFIAAIGVTCATFLSFPVACLAAIVLLFAAEASPFLNEALEQYTPETRDGYDWIAFVVRLVAVPIAKAFIWYGELRPTADLVDGRLVPWGVLVRAILSLGVSTAAMLGIGWLIFRKRELGTYSGR